jgi:hypothetical protein
MARWSAQNTTGGRLRKAVRYALVVPPRLVTLCHCIAAATLNLCQRPSSRG